MARTKSAVGLASQWRQALTRAWAAFAWSRSAHLGFAVVRVFGAALADDQTHCARAEL
jgi:hypothetical protein